MSSATGKTESNFKMKFPPLWFNERSFSDKTWSKTSHWFGGLMGETTLTHTCTLAHVHKCVDSPTSLIWTYWPLTLFSSVETRPLHFWSTVSIGFASDSAFKEISFPNTSTQSSLLVDKVPFSRSKHVFWVLFSAVAVLIQVSTHNCQRNWIRLRSGIRWALLLVYLNIVVNILFPIFR